MMGKGSWSLVSILFETGKINLGTEPRDVGHPHPAILDYGVVRADAAIQFHKVTQLRREADRGRHRRGERDAGESTEGALTLTADYYTNTHGRTEVSNS